MSSRFAVFDAELSKPEIRCKLCLAISHLERVDAEYVRGMLANPDKGPTHIEKVLDAGGVKVSAKTIANCRAGRHQAADAA